MDKKTQKRVTILRQHLQQLQQRLAGAKKQNDDPDELAQIEQELHKTQTELKDLLGN